MKSNTARVCIVCGWGLRFNNKGQCSVCGTMKNSYQMANFKLSDKEERDYKQFSKQHYEECRQDGVHITFIPTGVGYIVKLNCPKCRTVKDITDLDCW